jgi:TRAP-type C4-dicarboxylate transport system permease small subunit
LAVVGLAVIVFCSLLIIFLYQLATEKAKTTGSLGKKIIYTLLSWILFIPTAIISLTMFYLVASSIIDIVKGIFKNGSAD